MDIALQIIKITLCAFIVVSSPLVLRAIKKYIDKVEDQKLRNIVTTFVEAADQLYKEVDETGEKRKQYVIKSLEELGIKYNPYVDALIEQAVLLIF